MVMIKRFSLSLTVLTLAAACWHSPAHAAARALVGRLCSRLGATINNPATARAPTTPVSWVCEPAASATGVREELLLMGKPPKKPAARLATPRPTSSRLGSTR